MSYADADTVRLLLTTISTETQTAANLPNEAIEQAIADADAQIDARLASRYSVPFSSPPSVVANLSANIAAYLADLDYRQGREYASQYSPLYLRYQRATNMLERLAEGDDSLPDDGDGSVTTESGAVVVNPYYGDLMTFEDVFARPKFS